MKKQEEKIIEKILKKQAITQQEAQIIYTKEQLKELDAQHAQMPQLDSQDKEEYYKELFKEEIEIEQKIKELEQNKDNQILEIVKNLQHIQTPTPPKVSHFDLDTQFEKYLQHKEKHEKISKSSLKAYAATYRYLEYFTTKSTIFNFAFFKEIQQKLQLLPKDFFKHEKYYKSTFEEVLKLQKKEPCETLNTKTINNHMSNFKSFFDYLLYEEIIQDNPLSNIKPLQEQQETPKEEYTTQELELIFKSNIEQDYLNMCKVALYAGLRIEEVLSIKKEDIQDNLIHINLQDKTTKKHTRIIPIHKNLQSTINEQIKRNRGIYLFFEGNENHGARNIGKRVNRRLKSIVNSDFKTFHSLRKNFSQELELSTNAEDKIKKYLMGHSLSKDCHTHGVQ